MKVCLVGGIFDRPEALRAKHAVTPETVLLEGFHQLGVDVHASGHAGFRPSDAFDIVHVHHLGRAALTMASSASRARRVFTGHNGMIVTGREPSRLRRYAFRYVVDRADAVVALSGAEASYLGGVTESRKVHTIPNGIPAQVFRAHGHRQRQDGSGQDGSAGGRLLYVGQLIELKGLHFLLDALRLVRRTRPVHLRLVYHNAELEADLQRQAHSLGIDQDVTFVGILGPEQLAEEYQRADLLVLPSVAECLPSVVTEALLCGTPVVASSVCGVPEQVGRYGLVVPPGDVRALANAIDTVLADRARYQALASEMRAYAENKFRPETMVRAHLDLYERLLQGRPDPVRAHDAWSWRDAAVRVAARVYWRDAGSRRLAGV